MTMPVSRETLRILGTRGVPAAHGGFETFAERLALYLVDRGWRVVVYCQEAGHGPIVNDVWKGVERVRIPVASSGARSTIVFDWAATRHAARSSGTCLTLGYNTAIFCARLRLAGIHNAINMDGIEWAREKWGPVAKTWFRLNEWAGCLLADHLIADHPAIADHLARHADRAKISTIPYGADTIDGASADAVVALGLEPGRYATLIARPEPENSVIEAVRAFSMRPRGVLLAVLGRYDADNAYHVAVRKAAGPEVRFLGAIYDAAVVKAIRFHGLVYIHGHRVGGTNPSLIEALAAGNPVIAHDNRFNRWVAGPAARYFDDDYGVDNALTHLLIDPTSRSEMANAARKRAASMFNWPDVLGAYEAVLRRGP